MSNIEVKQKENLKHLDPEFNALTITGGTPLKGSVSAQGSKNAALPILSSLPLLEEAVIYNVPEISDVFDMIEILEYIGLDIEFKNGVITSKNKGIKARTIQEKYTRKIRASSLFMGPLLASVAEVKIGMPGGCPIGARPLDIHIEGFKQLGSSYKVDYGHYHIKGKNKGGEFTLPFPSVGATQNLISFSVLGNETTTLHNVAIEPEILDFIQFLNKAGAKIKVFPTKKIVIEGVESLKSVEYSVQADRIEVFTLLTAAIITKGEIKVTDCVPEHLSLPLQYLSLMGADVKTGRDYIEVKYVRELRGVKIETDVYPGFPTDCQQLISVLMTTAKSTSIVKENLFNNRFGHFIELSKMNAEVNHKDNIAMIEPSNLKCASVKPTDLRGTACLVLAALAAEGTSYVHNLKNLNRGYERLIEKISYLGGRITRI